MQRFISQITLHRNSAMVTMGEEPLDLFVLRVNSHHLGSWGSVRGLGHTHVRALVPRSHVNMEIYVGNLGKLFFCPENHKIRKFDITGPKRHRFVKFPYFMIIRTKEEFPRKFPYSHDSLVLPRVCACIPARTLPQLPKWWELTLSTNKSNGSSPIVTMALFLCNVSWEMERCMYS